MQIKAILFDIDGTLVDSNELHVTAWQKAFVGIGATFDRQTLHDQIGKGTDMLVPALLPNLDEEGTKKLDEAHGAVFKKQYLKRAKAFPNAHDLLAHAHKRGQKVVLASSAAKAELDHYIDLLDARDLIDVAISGDDVEQTKPAPDIFSTALSKLAGMSAGEVVVIGDTPYDVEAAAKCDMSAVAVRSGGFDDDSLRRAGAIAIYDDVAALLADYDNSPLGSSIRHLKLSPAQVGAP